MLAVAAALTEWSLRSTRDHNADWASLTDPSLVEETKREGDLVVDALKRFRSTTGRYPTSLDELVPHYMDMIPQPVAGDGRWHYRAVKSGSSFSLVFGVGSPSHPYPCYYYLPASGADPGGWRADL